MTVGLLSLGKPSGSNLSFNLVWTANALGAPASFRTAVTSAASIISAAFPTTSATINVNVDYVAGSGGGSNPNLANLLSKTYAQIKTILNANLNTTDMTNFVAALPSSDPGFGPYSFQSAGQKALGLLAGNNVASDGDIQLGSGIPSGQLVGAALHELTHVMGRTSYTPPFWFTRFTSSGVFEPTFGSPTPVSAYFSLDNGVTKLADFDVSNDTSDWLNGGAQDVALGNPPIDSCDALYTTSSQQILSAVDIKAMHIMGFY